MPGKKMTVAATAIATLGGGETTITGVRLPETEQTYI